VRTKWPNSPSLSIPSIPPLSTRRTMAIFENPHNAHTNVVALNRRLRCSETQSNVLVPSSSTLSDTGLRLRLGVQEDVRLLLERALRLHGEFGGHDCGVCRSRSRGFSRCFSAGGGLEFSDGSLSLCVR
jgi:hypothetical protein